MYIIYYEHNEYWSFNKIPNKIFDIIFAKSIWITRSENYITNKSLLFVSNLHKLKHLMDIQDNIFIL
jgi:hypothetical protein